MIAILAAVRPSSWNFVLFIHIAGAMVLVALSIVAIFAVRNAVKTGDQPATRFAYRVLLWGVLPAWFVMRIGAQLIANKENYNPEPGWFSYGYSISEGGLLFLIITLVLVGLAARKTKQGISVTASGGLRTAAVITWLLVVADVVAIWAMTTKPG
jgi:hypothetical protein